MAITTRRTSRSVRTRTATTLAAAGLLTIMIAPAAFAAPSGDQGNAVQAGDEVVEIHLHSIDGVIELDSPAATTGATDELSVAGANGSTTEDGVPYAKLTAAACDDHLVTLTPTGAIGPAPHAVAITAQVREWGQPGWDMASWAASAGTAIRTVTAQAADGATSTSSAVQAGSASDVIALTFCGSTTATGADQHGADQHGAASAEAPIASTVVDEPTVDESARDTTARDQPVITANAHHHGGAAEPGTRSNNERADAGTTDEVSFGVVTVDTTELAPIPGTDSGAADDPATHINALITVPVAHTEPTTAGVSGAKPFGPTTAGLIAAGLLGGVLLAPAAFRRSHRVERVHAGGQA